jgi:hypothetical protein
MHRLTAPWCVQGSVAAIHFIVKQAAKFDTDEFTLLQEIQQLGVSDVLYSWTTRSVNDSVKVCLRKMGRLLLDNTEKRKTHCRESFKTRATG